VDELVAQGITTYQGNISLAFTTFYSCCIFFYTIQAFYLINKLISIKRASPNQTINKLIKYYY
jgi:hypothetical protein